MFGAVISHECLGDGFFAGDNPGIPQAGQLVGIALAVQDGVHDG